MPEIPTFSPRPHRVFSAGFYPGTDFDYQVRCVLGGAPSGTADVGEVLATIDGVANNDHEHWFNAWRDTGSRVRAAADAAAAAGHRVSAAQRYLRAATYFAVALNSVSGLADDGQLVPTFRLHRFETSQRGSLARQSVGGQCGHPALRNHRHVQGVPAHRDELGAAVQCRQHPFGAGPEHALAKSFQLADPALALRCHQQRQQRQQRRQSTDRSSDSTTANQLPGGRR